MAENTRRATRHFGDFQTPIVLARAVANTLAKRGPYHAVLEPTCGTGSFIEAVDDVLAPATQTGVELQPSHATAATAVGQSARSMVEIISGDIYDFDVAGWAASHPSEHLLVVGNPPWVTNAELAGLGGANLPVKSNLKGLSGLAAVTGESNFDIAEFIIVHVAGALLQRRATVSMLCKESVARNVLQFAVSRGWPVADAEIRRIDARRWFGASVAACLLTFDTAPGTTWNGKAAVYDGLDDSEPRALATYGRKDATEDSMAYEAVAHLEGAPPLEWRQGVKHDAASVLVLQRGGRGWINGSGEPVEVEPARIFPLLRGGPLQKRTWPPVQAVVLPQFAVGEPTAPLEVEAPALWSYLAGHAATLDKRKSSIYRNKPRFSIFGVGPYTFSPWKVALASLYREPAIAAVGPCRGKPVVFDDTCYLVPTGDDAELAIVVAALLSHPSARVFLGSISNPNSKRVYTKKILGRFDWTTLADELDWAGLIAANDRAATLGGGTVSLASVAAAADEPLGAWVKRRTSCEDKPPRLF